MIGNVQILKNDGVSLVTNGIAHFILNDSQKQYIIYTIGEESGEYFKVYIGLEKLTDTEDKLVENEVSIIKNLLRSIGRNEDVSSKLTFLPLSSGLYHIYDRFKVAIPNKILDNLLRIQQQSQIKDKQNDEPVITENTFFDNSIVYENQKEVAKESESSIFSTPMQPIAPTLGDSEIEKKATSIDLETSNISINNQFLSANDLETTTELITNDQAKEAIKSVEKAQEIISDNIKLIKLYINQQKSLVESSKVEKNGELIKKDNIVSNNGDEAVEKIEATLLKNDVVQNIELAPQPEISLDVLEDETVLKNNYSFDSSSHIDTMTNLEGNSSTNNGALLEPQSVGESINSENLEPQFIATSVQSLASELQDVTQHTDTSSMVEPDRLVIASTSSDPQQSESLPEYIDTNAMVQQINNPQTFDTQETSAINDLDSSHSPILSTPTQVVENTIPLTQNQPDKDQQNFGFATQIPMYENQIIGNDEGASISAIASSQIDSSSTPVVIPDGQTTELEQNLVLTPEAFKTAA